MNKETKTLGQIAYEAYADAERHPWDDVDLKFVWERVARAVMNAYSERCLAPTQKTKP